MRAGHTNQKREVIRTKKMARAFPARPGWAVWLCQAGGILAILAIVKVVGNRGSAKSPEEALRRAGRLIREADRLARHPRPRGFIFKAKTWEDYECWRRSQANPRLW